MNRRQACSYLVITLTLAAAGCHGAPGQNPIKGGPVNTGPQTLTAARKFLEGRWLLESFEVRPPGSQPFVITLLDKASG